MLHWLMQINDIGECVIKEKTIVGIMIDSEAIKPLYTLRVAAELSGISKYSIRQYIDRGLVIPFKTETDRHLFSQIDIKRLKSIQTDLAVNGLNIAGIKRVMAQTPCWLIKPCKESEYSQCNSYSSSNQPCWEVTIKGPICKDTDCRTCNVYLLIESVDDLKELFKDFGKYANPSNI